MSPLINRHGRPLSLTAISFLPGKLVLKMKRKKLFCFLHRLYCLIPNVNQEMLLDFDVKEDQKMERWLQEISSTIAVNSNGDGEEAEVPRPTLSKQIFHLL